MIKGWIECAGIADRCDYDLRQHSKHSGDVLSIERLNSNEKDDEISFFMVKIL